MESGAFVEVGGAFTRLLFKFVGTVVKHFYDNDYLDNDLGRRGVLEGSSTVVRILDFPVTPVVFDRRRRPRFRISIPATAGS